MLVRFTEITMPQIDQSELELRRVIDGEDAHITPKFKHDFAPMTFDMADVKCFNESNDKSCTTIRFKGKEDSNVVKVDYKTFQNIYMEATCQIITSFLPDDYVSDEENGENDEDEEYDS